MHSEGMSCDREARSSGVRVLVTVHQQVWLGEVEGRRDEQRRWGAASKRRKMAEGGLLGGT